MNMTDLPQPDPPTASWKTLQMDFEHLPTGERHPFFPLGEITESVFLKVEGEPVFAREGFHGQYSIFEMDVSRAGRMYRLCVSGRRLAKALAALAPARGTMFKLTPIGVGKAREWRAEALSLAS